MDVASGQFWPLTHLRGASDALRQGLKAKLSGLWVDRSETTNHTHIDVDKMGKADIEQLLVESMAERELMNCWGGWIGSTPGLTSKPSANAS
jgi:hypothetical protein